jgi:hypothetical protein
MTPRSLPRERRGRAICDDTGRDRSRRLSSGPNALQSELGRAPWKSSPVASTMSLGGQRPSAEWEEWGRIAGVGRTAGAGGIAGIQEPPWRLDPPPKAGVPTHPSTQTCPTRSIRKRAQSVDLRTRGLRRCAGGFVDGTDVGAEACRLRCALRVEYTRRDCCITLISFRS